MIILVFILLDFVRGSCWNPLALCNFCQNFYILCQSLLLKSTWLLQVRSNKPFLLFVSSCCWNQPDFCKFGRPILFFVYRCCWNQPDFYNFCHTWLSLSVVVVKINPISATFCPTCIWVRIGFRRQTNLNFNVLKLFLQLRTCKKGCLSQAILFKTLSDFLEHCYLFSLHCLTFTLKVE